jgi:hypothetical protein
MQTHQMRQLDAMMADKRALASDFSADAVASKVLSLLAMTHG